MKHTVEVSELSGHNESPVAGNYIVSSNRDFTNRFVTVGSSVLYNETLGTSATVTAVTATQIDAATVFYPGDMWRVTLSANWTLQNSDMPVIEVECNICGFSYPQKDMLRGICKTCQDKD